VLAAQANAQEVHRRLAGQASGLIGRDKPVRPRTRRPLHPSSLMRLDRFAQRCRELLQEIVYNHRSLTTTLKTVQDLPIPADRLPVEIADLLVRNGTRPANESPFGAHPSAGRAWNAGHDRSQAHT